MKLKRVMLDGSITEIRFDTLSNQFLVKNFSEDVIYVSFDSNLVEENAIKIPSGYGQTCVINNHISFNASAKSKVIYIKGTGEVEVQQVCYR